MQSLQSQNKTDRDANMMIYKFCVSHTLSIIYLILIYYRKIKIVVAPRNFLDSSSFSVIAQFDQILTF